MAGEDEDDQQGHGASQTGDLTKYSNTLTFFIQSLLFLSNKTLDGHKHDIYVLIKILKFCTGSSAKSYQCKFGISRVLGNQVVAAEGLGKAIRDVIHYHTLRGKFSSVHPELRGEGIVRVDVGEKGLHFVREMGELLKS